MIVKSRGQDKFVLTKKGFLIEDLGFHPKTNILIFKHFLSVSFKKSECLVLSFMFKALGSRIKLSCPRGGGLFFLAIRSYSQNDQKG